MKVINNSIYNLSHNDFSTKKNYYCEVGSFLDVPEDIAEKWLKIEGVKPYVTTEDIEAEKKKAVEEALKAERAKAKTEEAEEEQPKEEVKKPAKRTTKKK